MPSKRLSSYNKGNTKQVQYDIGITIDIARRVVIQSTNYQSKQLYILRYSFFKSLKQENDYRTTIFKK